MLVYVVSKCVVKMDDLMNWRWKIGRFKSGGPKGRRWWDPYGARRCLSPTEVFFTGLCFVLTVMSVYCHLEAQHQLDTGTVVGYGSILDDAAWRRRHGLYCCEDEVSRLTVSVFSTIGLAVSWGVYELYCRLRLMWGSDIEEEPGPGSHNHSQNTSSSLPDSKKDRSRSESTSGRSGDVSDAVNSPLIQAAGVFPCGAAGGFPPVTERSNNASQESSTTTHDGALAASSEGSAGIAAVPDSAVTTSSTAEPALVVTQGKDEATPTSTASVQSSSADAEAVPGTSEDNQAIDAGNHDHDAGKQDSTSKTVAKDSKTDSAKSKQNNDSKKSAKELSGQKRKKKSGRGRKKAGKKDLCEPCEHELGGGRRGGFSRCS